MNDEPAEPQGAARPRLPGASRPATDPAAVADILASIRSIVADEGRRVERSPMPRSDSREALLLTPEMRIGAGDPRAAANPPARARRAQSETASETAAREADDAFADMVRAVLREEIEGEFGARLAERMRAIARRERSG